MKNGKQEKNFFYKIINNKIIIIIIQILLSSIIVINMINVFMRYVLGSSFGWVGEASRYLFIWLSFITGSLIVTRDEHLGIGDAFINILPSFAKNIVIIVVNILAGFFTLVLIRYGFIMSQNLMFRRSTVLGIKMGYVYSVIFISGCFLLIHLIYDTIQAIKDIKNSDSI